MTEQFPISVELYHAMIAAGAISDEHRVELIRGRLVKQMGKHPLHETANSGIFVALLKAIPASWCAFNQRPVTMGDSEPEPDIVVIRGKARDFASRHPRPGEAGLLVDVSDSSLLRDRGYKRQLYGAAGIPYYWIVNLIDRRIEVYSEPANGDYTVRRDYAPGEAIPLILDGVAVAQIETGDLIP